MDEIALSNWSHEGREELIMRSRAWSDADLVNLNMLDTKTGVINAAQFGGQSMLSVVRGLKSIGLLNIKFNGRESRYFAHLQAVDSILCVDLEDVEHMPDGALEAIAGFKHMHKLSIYECEFDAPADALRNAQHLRELSLDAFPDFPFWRRGPDLSGLQSLRKLTVSGDRVPDKFFRQLPSQLAHLKFISCTIPPTGFELLGTLGSLESLVLDLSWSECEDGSLRSLGNLTQLCSLKVVSYPAKWDMSFDFLQNVDELDLTFYGRPERVAIDSLRDLRKEKLATELQFYNEGEESQPL